MVTLHSNKTLTRTHTHIFKKLNKIIKLKTQCWDGLPPYKVWSGGVPDASKTIQAIATVADCPPD